MKLTTCAHPSTVYYHRFIGTMALLSPDIKAGYMQAISLPTFQWVTALNVAGFPCSDFPIRFLQQNTLRFLFEPVRLNAACNGIRLFINWPNYLTSADLTLLSYHPVRVTHWFRPFHSSVRHPLNVFAEF